MIRPVTVVLAALAVLPVGPADAQESKRPATEVKGRYADINGLKMYYELHGTGRPLVVLHGALGWASASPGLATDRQQIAVELQGHGHTAGVDRPLRGKWGGKR